VLLVSQATGLAGIAALVAASGVGAPPAGDLLPAFGAGVAGAAALGAFYRGLAIGTMSVVAPISATGAVVPVVVGLATGDDPGSLQLVGMAAAVTGVVLVARELDESGARPAATRHSVALALAAALGFGTFFVGMDASAESGVLWSLLTARVAAVVAVLAVVVAARPSLRAAPPALAALVAVGVLDLTANGLYTAASTEGLLSVVAVLASLYPVMTVVLARAVLGERVRPIQNLGIVAALAGVALIASG
jgi:drug/metabolite transporter (DMT)-like permease